MNAAPPSTPYHSRPTVPRMKTFQRFSQVNRMSHTMQWAVGVMLFIWAWTLIYGLFVFEPKYSSQAMVLIKDSAVTGRYVLPDQYYALTTTSSNATNPVLNTMGLLKSKTVSLGLWEFLKTNAPEELKRRHIKTVDDWQAFFGDGKAFIKAKNPPGTDMITLQFQWNDSKLAQQGLSNILNSFQWASREVNRSEEGARQKYLDAQVADVQKQLDALRGKQSVFKSGTRIVNVTQQAGDLAQNRMALISRLNEVESMARGKEAEIGNYRSVIGMSPREAVRASAVGLNGNLSRLQTTLYDLSQRHAFLSSTLTDKNPKVQEVAAQIEQTKADIQTELRRTLGRGYRGGPAVAVTDATRGAVIGQMVTAQAEANQYRSQARDLRNKLNAIEAQISKFPELEASLKNMDEKEKSLSAALDELRKKQMEAQIKQAETLSNVLIIDTPTLPLAPKFPGRTHIIVLGLLFGVAAGGMLLLLKTEGVSQYLPDLRTVTERVGRMVRPAASGLFRERPMRNMEEEEAMAAWLDGWMTTPNRPDVPASISSLSPDTLQALKDALKRHLDPEGDSFNDMGEMGASRVRSDKESLTAGITSRRQRSQKRPS